MISLLRSVFAVTIITSSVVVNAFYVPGVQPQSFRSGDAVELKVNAMTSIHTQIPKDYYRLPYCLPQRGPKMASENLGEFLTGNKIQTSPYEIRMREDMYCKVLCQKQLSELDTAKLRLHIKYGYHHNWIIDNLPSANIGALNPTTHKPQKHYAGGFPIGFIAMDTKESYIYNHVNIVIDYHTLEEEASKEAEGTGAGLHRVVGFSVEPLSIAHKFSGSPDAWSGAGIKEGYGVLDSCPKQPAPAQQHVVLDSISQNQIVKDHELILYTYDVVWKYSDVHWSSRWDVYLNEDHLVPAKVHWFSITNSIIVVLVLSGLVISILVRNLRRDIAQYNKALEVLVDAEEATGGGDDADAEKEETGWKLIHADVFRPPASYPMLYCVFCGSGVQLCITGFCAIVFSAIGFLSPARRGSLLNAFLAFYTLTGLCSGYISSRLYKTFKGKEWQKCTILTATLFPGSAFSIFILFNTVLSFLNSSGSVPFLDLLIVVFMWCCVAVPLTFAGAYVGFQQPVIEFPTITSSIERTVPPPPSPYLDPRLGMALMGIIPFGAAYVELFFIMTSLWMNQFYYVFGFTLLVYCFLLLICVEVTVLAVYYQLCAENHRWWWFSFFSSGSVALYIFLYSCVWFQQLEGSRMIMTYVLYFGYMSLISVVMMLITGSIGALASLLFIRMIFSSIKID